MNVLKAHKRITIKTLEAGGVSQREIARRTGVDRKTIRRHARAANPPGWPPALRARAVKFPHPGHRETRGFRQRVGVDGALPGGAGATTRSIGRHVARWIPDAANGYDPLSAHVGAPLETVRRGHRELVPVPLTPFTK